jgi:hypothetical protein
MVFGKRKQKTCFNCQYYREPGSFKALGPGQGNWCSNSSSSKFMTRMKAAGSCSCYAMRGKKAPLRIKAAVKGMSAVNRWMLWVFKHRALK